MSARRLRPMPIAVPSFERRYGLMAETVLFQTNDPVLLAAADASFGRFPLPADGRDPLVIRLFTEEARGDRGDRGDPWHPGDPRQLPGRGPVQPPGREPAPEASSTERRATCS